MADDAHWTGAIRQAAEQDDRAYCRNCLVDDGPDADPLDEPTTALVAADRADQDTRTLGDTLHVYGWICERHDTLCVRDPFEFEPPIDGLLMVALESESDDSVLGHIPVYDLASDRAAEQIPFDPANRDLVETTD